jgi:cobalt-zinc-cadmium efflux system membrane fusion protein
MLLAIGLLGWNLSAGAQLLNVSQEEQDLLEIRVQSVSPVAAGGTGELDLRVGFSPDGEWAIKTPYSGILHRAFVQVGDRVAAGDPLVTVRSAEVVGLQRDYLKARAELDLQETARLRDKKLSEAGSVSSRRWQETKHAYEMARAEYSGLHAQLLLAGFSEADIEKLSGDMEISPDITLRAPVDALVLQRPAMLGEHLDGSELLARLGEPDKLVLEGMLSKSAAAHLSEGAKISMQDDGTQAVLVFVSSVIDPDTQTVQVRAEPLDPVGLLPGQLTRWVVQSSGSLLTVPSSAIVKLDGDDVAYIQVEGGFETRQVNVRSTGSGQWIVLSGLEAGDRVAVSGTAVLKGMSIGMGGGDE